ALERRVEMRQWQRDASDAYAMQWSAAQIDSSGFDTAHRNPAQLPINGSRWWTHAARLQGSAVAADVLGTLDGWQPFAPDLSQLPPNLAASFQPDGDWLSTSQDPAHPMIGDVRLQWQVLKQAPPPSGIVLRDGEWRLPDTSIVATQPAMPPPVQPSAAPTRVQQLFGNYVLWLIGAGIVLALLILLATRRRRR
ncbi:MAG: TMEM43 family protein, partial [Lysobacteraceae bacterium]